MLVQHGVSSASLYEPPNNRKRRCPSYKQGQGEATPETDLC